MKTFFKSTYYAAVTILFLVIAVVGLTQTKTFRSYLRTLAINELKTVLDGTVSFKTIEGNLATGLRLTDVIVARDGREILATEQLEARYDLTSLLVQKVSISRLMLIRPRIHLWRGLDGRWNVDHLIIPGPKSDTASSPLTLDFHRIELRAASIQIIDSLDLARRAAAPEPGKSPDTFDFAVLNLDPVSMHAALHISPEGISASVNSLEAEFHNPDFHLFELSGHVILRPLLTQVKSLSIRTGNSKFSLDARLNGIDIGSIEDLRQLETLPVDVQLTVDRLDFAEFKKFLPGPVDFLDKSAAFDVKASGSFGNLNVHEVSLRTPRTFVKIQGSIRNLHRPRFLELNVSAQDNIIHPQDLADLLPGLRLPDLNAVGILNCDLHFQGSPDKFKAFVGGKISSGDFTVEADMDLRSGFTYSGAITTTGLDLGTLLENRHLASDLNTRATIAGSGTSLPAMTSVLRMQADSSVFLGLPVSNSVLVVDVADKSLRSNLLLNAGETRLDLQARSGFASDDSITYDVKGIVYSLDLGTVLEDPRYKSDLSFTLDAAGRGLDLSTINFEAHLGFLGSSFGSDTFGAQDLFLAYKTADSSPSLLTMRSNPVDLRVEGTFTPGAVVEILQHAGTILAEAIAARFEGLDSLRGRTAGQPRKPFTARRGLPSDTVSATIAADIRNLYPLGVLLDERIDGAADVQSTVRGSLKDLHVSGAVAVREFSMAGVTPMDMSNVDLTFILDHLQGQQTLDRLHSEVFLNARRVFIDSTLFTDVVIHHMLVKDSASYSLTATIDSTIGVNVEGTSAYVPHLLDLTLSRVDVRISEHDIHNPDPVSLQIGRDGVRFNNAVVQHEAEEIVLNGVLDPGGYSEIRFSVDNFLLNNLKEFSSDPAYEDKVHNFNGVLDLRGTFRGDLDRPAFNVALNAEGVKIGETVFGKITGRGTFQNGIADMFLEFRSKPNEPRVSPELFVSGIMPVRIGAASDLARDQEMDLTLRSRGFRLEFLDPFIPLTSRLRGSLTGDITMSGTPRSPLYEGSLSLDETRFLFIPLGIEFDLKGKLVPSGKTIVLEDMVLSNTSADRVPGIIDGLGSLKLGGKLNLEGLSVRQFDVTADGQLLIMKESARLPQMPLYGNIYIGTGANALRWFGAPERSFVAGDVLIKNANITFPPSRNVILERAQLFTVSFVDDTSKTISALESRGGRSLAMAQKTPIVGPEETQEPAVRNGNESRQEASFLDNIVFNLTLETSGLTQVRFVFNPLTGEELSADLNGRLIFIKDESSSRVTGELDVGQRSYYKYFKTLQATGNLLFTGDITNPELDIKATYEGTYTTPDSIEQKVIVRLDITGTRGEPKVKIGLDVYDRDGNKLAPRADPQADAIAFLVSGTFKEEMTQGEQSTLLTSSLLGSIGSSLISGPLTELVRNEFGYITSIDVYYYGGGDRTFGQAAGIRLTGEIGDAVIRLGGQVLEDPIGNANVSIQFPMSSLTGSEAWRALILEIERRSERIESIEQRPPSTGVRLLYRITF